MVCASMHMSDIPSWCQVTQTPASGLPFFFHVCVCVCVLCCVLCDQTVLCACVCEFEPAWPPCFDMQPNIHIIRRGAIVHLALRTVAFL